MQKTFFALAIILAVAFAGASDFVSVGTNYNLPGYYYYSNGWQSSSPCNTFYANASISNSYYTYSGVRVQYYPQCYNYDYYNDYYFGQLRVPLPYPYISSPRDLGYGQKNHYSFHTGSHANAYYAAPVQVHLNSIGSTTYPPSFQYNSEQVGTNYNDQQYYLNPPAQDNAPSERLEPSQLTYAYSGERWLDQPNYWYSRPGAGGSEPRTSSTFPPSLFIGFYQQGTNQQAYYNDYQVKDPQASAPAKKPLEVISASTTGNYQ